MCGCLVLLIGAVFPRAAIVLLEIFTNWNDTAFDSFWIGFIGWLMLPYTTLAYVLMDQLGDPINGFGWVIVSFALLLDLGSWFGSARNQQRRMAA